MTDLQLHPLCTLFPRMDGVEFNELISDIKANGQREPIIVHDGMILDGGNRWRACIEAGIEPHTMEFGGGNLVDYVLSVNLHRRHLTAGQRGAIVASCQNWAEAQGIGKPGKIARLATRSDRAGLSGVSDGTQKMADKVAKADPELAKAVGRGETTLTKAVEQITGKRPGAKKTVPEDDDADTHPEYAEIDQMRDSLDSMVDEVDRLTNLLAGNVVAVDAEERELLTSRMDALTAENKKLRAEVRIITDSRDAWQNQVAALKSQVSRQNKELAKLTGKKR